jgi:hypothetical protein
MDSITNGMTISPGKAASIARRNYLHLLRNEHEAHDENRDALSLTAHVLGRSAEQVAADVKVIRRVKQSDSVVARDRAAEAKNAELELQQIRNSNTELLG